MVFDWLADAIFFLQVEAVLVEVAGDPTGDLPIYVRSSNPPEEKQRTAKEKAY